MVHLILVIGVGDVVETGRAEFTIRMQRAAIGKTAQGLRLIAGNGDVGEDNVLVAVKDAAGHAGPVVMDRGRLDQHLPFVIDGAAKGLRHIRQRCFGVVVFKGGLDQLHFVETVAGLVGKGAAPLGVFGVVAFKGETIAVEVAGVFDGATNRVIGQDIIIVTHRHGDLVFDKVTLENLHHIRTACPAIDGAAAVKGAVFDKGRFHNHRVGAAPSIDGAPLIKGDIFAKEAFGDAQGAGTPDGAALAVQLGISGGLVFDKATVVDNHRASGVVDGPTSQKVAVGQDDLVEFENAAALNKKDAKGARFVAAQAGGGGAAVNGHRLFFAINGDRFCDHGQHLQLGQLMDATAGKVDSIGGSCGQILAAAVATGGGRNDLQRLAQRAFGGTDLAGQRRGIPFIFVGSDKDRRGVDRCALGGDDCAIGQGLIGTRLGQERRS